MMKNPLSIIFITVFIDLIGFGMVIPLSPYLGREYGATAFEVGLLLSVYSLMQIVFSPLWGKWSDRIGRRPVILVSLVGTGLAHMAFAFSGSLWMLFVSRTLAGIFGANISTAFAYAADVTKDKDRSKGMGLIGAAFALGFIFGPFFGGLLGDVGSQLGAEPPLGHSFPALVAALICFLNFIFAVFILPESLTVEKRKAPPVRKSRIQSAVEYLTRPVTGSLLAVTFLASFSMSQMEASLFLLVNDRFGFDLTEGSFAFAYVGVVIAFTQGYLIRKLLPITGDRKLLLAGTVISGLALACVGYAPTISLLAIFITVMSLGFGIRMPSLNGSISLTCAPQEQGAVMGVNQSLQALGRVVGPALGGWIYGAWGAEANFLVAGLTGLAGVPIILKVYNKIPDTNLPHPSGEPPKIESKAPGQLSQDTAVTPKPVVIDRPREPRPAPFEPPKIEHVRKEDRITLISAFQFRGLFSNNVNFLFFDLRAIDCVPQYSRAVHTTDAAIMDELNKRTGDKRTPILILCEDGVLSKEVAKKIADTGFINVVVVEGGARALNRTGHV